MADKKVEKALYGPSTLEVALGALLGLVAGVALACVYLVFKPVVAVKETPKEPARGVVYYLAGNTDAVKGRSWQAKVETFLNGGSVVASEEELNAWAASLNAPAPAKSASATKEAAPAEGAAKKDEFISASGLNFRLSEGKLHIAQKVLLNYYGLSKEVIMQASGSFDRAGESFVFNPEQIYLGSCPLHAVPGAADSLAKLLVGRQAVPDDFRAAWAKITAIGVENRLLRITTQP